MSNQPPKPPKHTSKPDEANEPTTEAQTPEEPTTNPSPSINEELRQARSRIRKAIFDIADQCKTVVQTELHRYPGVLTERNAYQGEAALPKPLKRHGRDASRSQYDNRANLILFHVGNAIVTFYAAVRGDEGGKPLKARIKHLEEIASEGLSNYRVYGSEFRGYMLVHESAYRKLTAQHQNEQEKGD